jgi:hypothetical protein
LADTTRKLQAGALLNDVRRLVRGEPQIRRIAKSDPIARGIRERSHALVGAGGWPTDRCTNLRDVVTPKGRLDPFGVGQRLVGPNQPRPRSAVNQLRTLGLRDGSRLNWPRPPGAAVYLRLLFALARAALGLHLIGAGGRAVFSTTPQLNVVARATVLVGLLLHLVRAGGRAVFATAPHLQRQIGLALAGVAFRLHQRLHVGR